MPIQAIDLTIRPPRSPRVRLGGYVILPRMLDKGRATIIGKNGQYNYHCPLDQQFVSFTGIDADQLREQLAQDKGDADILDWINANSKCRRTPSEIAAWSAYQEQRVPTDLETRKVLNDYHSQLAPHRKDIATWFDLLDLDDYVSFGGKA